MDWTDISPIPNKRFILLVHVCHAETIEGESSGAPDRSLGLSLAGWKKAFTMGRQLHETYGFFDEIAHAEEGGSVQTTEGITASYPVSLMERVRVTSEAALNERLEEGLMEVVKRLTLYFRGEVPHWLGKKICLVGNLGTHWALRHLLEGLSEAQAVRLMEAQNPPLGSASVYRYEDGVFRRDDNDAIFAQE